MTRIHLDHVVSAQIIRAMERVVVFAIRKHGADVMPRPGVTPATALGALTRLPASYAGKSKSALRAVFRKFNVSVPKGHFALEALEDSFIVHCA